MTDRIMIAVDPDKLEDLARRMEALENAIRSVTMQPRPEWLSLSDYATDVGVTPRTVRNWIEAGKVETRREGEALFIRVNRAA